MRRFFLAVFLIIVSVSFSVLEAQTKQVASFRTVKVSGNIEAELIYGQTPKVEYTMLEGDPDELSIDVLGDQLDIRFTHRRFWEYFSRAKARVKIYYPALQRVHCSAGSHIVSVGTVKTDHMDIHCSSGADCELSLDCADVRVDVSSGAGVRIGGTGKELIFDVSSGAHLDAFDFVVFRASGDASSGASAKINCTEYINAEASSGGEVRFRGNPCTINKNMSSGGSIRAL